VSRPDVTVVLASHDLGRWDHLRSAVESVLAQVVDAPVVVAVDHNPRLAERVATAFPTVEVVPNRHGAGASGTRNSGAAGVHTPFIAFLDDDARAHPGWLDRLLAPFEDPRVVGTGGGVSAAWSAGARPRWFPEEFDWVVGASYRGMPTVTAPIRNVWSENMAVRREVFAQVGGFRLDFGKVGNRSRPEDTDLCIRMAAATAGGRWVYVPDARVDHHVPTGRTTYGYFLRRTYLEGRGKIEMSRLLGPAERLDSERDYLRRPWPTGIRNGPAAARRGRADGLLRAAAITAGTAAAGVGATAALVGGRSGGGAT
jgi:GT2 family glycosyltransferase